MTTDPKPTPRFDVEKVSNYLEDAYRKMLHGERGVDIERIVDGFRNALDEIDRLREEVRWEQDAAKVDRALAAAEIDRLRERERLLEDVVNLSSTAAARVADAAYEALRNHDAQEKR